MAHGGGAQRDWASPGYGHDRGPEEDLGDLLGSWLLGARRTVVVATVGIQRMALRAAMLACLLALLLWVASFLYGSFYYTFMPTPHFSTPVHYHYRTDCDSLDSTLCSFPVANVSLLRHGKNQVMTYGQPYRISLELEMPESTTNQELGMFMVRMSCYTNGGRTFARTARTVSKIPDMGIGSAMLHYRSALLRALGTLVFSPLLLTGVSEERQLVEVELFSEYKDNSYAPTVGAVLEIQSRRIQIYSAQLFIHAHFSGIRYILFYYPVLSAMVGVASNFAFLSVLILFSYLQFSFGAVGPPQLDDDITQSRQRANSFLSRKIQTETNSKERNGPTEGSPGTDPVDEEESTPEEGVCRVYANSKPAQKEMEEALSPEGRLESLEVKAQSNWSMTNEGTIRRRKGTGVEELLKEGVAEPHLPDRAPQMQAEGCLVS